MEGVRNLFDPGQATKWQLRFQEYVEVIMVYYTSNCASDQRHRAHLSYPFTSNLEPHMSIGIEDALLDYRTAALEQERCRTCSARSRGCVTSRLAVFDSSACLFMIIRSLNALPSLLSSLSLTMMLRNRKPDLINQSGVPWKRSLPLATAADQKCLGGPSPAD